MSPRKDLKVKITGDETELKKSVARASASLKRLGKGINQIAIGFAKTAAVAGGIGFAVKKGLIDPFAEQQQALAGLAAALDATGRDAAEGLRKIADEAARLQSITTAADEALIAASGTLATLAVDLDTDELVRAQTAIVGIADTFLKGDVQAAALLLGKTLGGPTNALSRYGIQVDAAGSASEKLAAILGSASLGAAFEVAQAKADTFAGRLTQLGNAAGDLREVFGGIVVESLAIEGGAKDLTDRIAELTAQIDANSAKWVAWLQVSMGSLKLIAQGLVGLVRIAFETGQLIGHAFDVVADLWVNSLRAAFQEVLEFANTLLDDLDALGLFDVDFRFEVDEDVFAGARAAAFEFEQDLEAIDETVQGLVTTWVDLENAIIKANAASGGLKLDVPSGAGAGTGTGGGGGAPTFELRLDLPVPLADLTLEALAAEMLEVTGGAERFKDELEAIDRLIKGLDTEIGVTFFGGLKDQAKGIFDLSAIVSTAFGNLLSGGLSTVISGAFSAIGGLLGPSEAEIAAAEATRANTEAVRKNMEAADRLGENLNTLSLATVTLPFDTFVSAVQAFQERQPTSEKELQELQNAGIGLEWIDVMREFGLTASDVDAIIKATGLSFDSIARDADALLVAIANLNNFNRDFGLLQKQFQLFDIDGPGEKFEAVIDLLAGQVSDDFAAILEGLTPENFDAFLEDIFADGFAGFDIDLLGDDLTFEQFLSAIGFAETALDGLATEIERATSAIHNAPAGFKVAAFRFRASDPIDLDGTGRRLRRGRGVGVTDTIVSRVGSTRSEASPINIAGDLVVQGVQNVDDLLVELEVAVGRRHRTGVSVFATTTGRGQGRR